MANVNKEKKKLLNRVRRLRGQVKAIERTLEEDAECSDVLHSIAACRGALDSLMAQVIEGHIRSSVLAPDGKASKDQEEAAQDLIGALKTYLK